MSKTQDTQRIARRTKATINEIVDNNEFAYYMHVQFNTSSMDESKAEFEKLKDEIKRKLHNMNYIAVPVYENRNLTYKCVIGNIKDIDLDLVYQKDLVLKNKTKTYWYVTALKHGKISVTTVDEKQSIKNFINYYVNVGYPKKANEHRFFCSRNLIRKNYLQI